MTISSRPYSGENATCSSSQPFPNCLTECRHLTLHIPGISPGIAELYFISLLLLFESSVVLVQLVGPACYEFGYYNTTILSPFLKFLRLFSLQHMAVKLLSTKAAVNAKQSGLKHF